MNTRARFGICLLLSPRPGPSHGPRLLPPGFGLRLSSGAFQRGEASESGRGLPQSKTPSRRAKRGPVHDPNARSKSEVEALHRPNPLTPSLSPSGGEGARRGGAGERWHELSRFILLNCGRRRKESLTFSAEIGMSLPRNRCGRAGPPGQPFTLGAPGGRALPWPMFLDPMPQPSSVAPTLLTSAATRFMEASRPAASQARSIRASRTSAVCTSRNAAHISAAEA